MSKLITLTLPVTLIDARDGTGASETFALPARNCVLAWQTSFDTAPAAIDIDIDVSIDGVVWATLDTSTATAGELRIIPNSTAARFIRAFVNTNTGDKDVTVVIIAKVANP